MQTEDQKVAVEDVTPTASTEQAQQPVTEVSAEPGAEQTAVAVEPTAQEKPKNDWVQRRIDQLTREKHEEKRQREALEAQLRQFQQPAADQSQAANPPVQDVYKAAEQLVKQREFDSACNKVFEAGESEFPDWDSSLKTFGMLGGASPEFLEAITSMDAGHKVLHHLGQDPEAAERLLSLPPLRMALELARLETTLGQKKPPPVSSAPAPITPVGGKSAPVEPEEFASTADYIAWKKRNRK